MVSEYFTNPSLFEIQQGYIKTYDPSLRGYNSNIYCVLDDLCKDEGTTRSVLKLLGCLRKCGTAN